MTPLYTFFGGRKQFNTYLALVLALFYAAFTTPDFITFVAAIGGILGIGSFMVAFEDRARPSK